MKGIDVHLDTNIGKRLSALGGTLTALAGEPDEIMGEDEDGDQDMFSANVYEVVFILFPFSNVNGIILCFVIQLISLLSVQISDTLS